MHAAGILHSQLVMIDQMQPCRFVCSQLKSSYDVVMVIVCVCLIRRLFFFFFFFISLLAPVSASKPFESSTNTPTTLTALYWIEAYKYPKYPFKQRSPQSIPTGCHGLHETTATECHLRDTQQLREVCRLYISMGMLHERGGLRAIQLFNLVYHSGPTFTTFKPSTSFTLSSQFVV